MIFRAKEKFGGGGPRLRLGNGRRRGERRGGPICIRNDERSGRWHSVWPRCGDIGHLLTPEATDPPRLVRFSLSPHDPLPPFSCPPNAERVFVTRIYPSLSLSLSLRHLAFLLLVVIGKHFRWMEEICTDTNYILCTKIYIYICKKNKAKIKYKERMLNSFIILTI